MNIKIQNLIFILWQTKKYTFDSFKIKNNRAMMLVKFIEILELSGTKRKKERGKQVYVSMNDYIPMFDVWKSINTRWFKINVTSNFPKLLMAETSFQIQKVFKSSVGWC